MSAEKNWQFDLEEYIKQDEPGQNGFDFCFYFVKLDS